MRRALLAVAVTLAVLAPPASAVTVTGSARTSELQGWVDASRLPMIDVTITVTDTDCPTLEAIACAVGKTGDVYLSPDADRFVWMHEVWHVIEYQAFTDADRAAATALVGLTGHDWNDASLKPYEPRECFASTAAYLSLYRRFRFPFEGTGGDVPCLKTGIANRRPMRQLIRRAVAG